MTSSASPPTHHTCGQGICRMTCLDLLLQRMPSSTSHHVQHFCSQACQSICQDALHHHTQPTYSAGQRVYDATLPVHGADASTMPPRPRSESQSPQHEHTQIGGSRTWPARLCAGPRNKRAGKKLYKYKKSWVKMFKDEYLGSYKLENQFRCKEGCPKRFESDEKLMNHLWKHHTTTVDSPGQTQAATASNTPQSPPLNDSHASQIGVDPEISGTSVGTDVFQCSMQQPSKAPQSSTELSLSNETSSSAMFPTAAAPSTATAESNDTPLTTPTELSASAFQDLCGIDYNFNEFESFFSYTH